MRLRIPMPAVLLLAVCCGADSLQAAVLTVSQSGPSSFTTVRDALTSAASGDVIRILDSATYQEDLPAVTVPVLTIESASGQAPVLERATLTTSGVEQVLLYESATGTGTLTLRGDSPTSRLTLRQDSGPAACLATGGPATATHALVLENVELNKGALRSGPCLWIANAGTHQVFGLFTQGGSSGGDNSSVVLTGSGLTSFADCDFYADGDGQISPAFDRNVQVGGGAVHFSDCRFGENATDSWDVGLTLFGGVTTVTLEDCLFARYDSRAISIEAAGRPLLDVRGTTFSRSTRGFSFVALTPHTAGFRRSALDRAAVLAGPGSETRFRDGCRVRLYGASAIWVTAPDQLVSLRDTEVDGGGFNAFFFNNAFGSPTGSRIEGERLTLNPDALAFASLEPNTDGVEIALTNCDLTANRFFIDHGGTDHAVTLTDCELTHNILFRMKGPASADRAANLTMTNCRLRHVIGEGGEAMQFLTEGVTGGAVLTLNLTLNGCDWLGPNPDQTSALLHVIGRNLAGQISQDVRLTATVEHSTFAAYANAFIFYGNRASQVVIDQCDFHDIEGSALWLQDPTQNSGFGVMPNTTLTVRDANFTLSGNAIINFSSAATVTADYIVRGEEFFPLVNGIGGTQPVTLGEFLFNVPAFYVSTQFDSPDYLELAAGTAPLTYNSGIGGPEAYSGAKGPRTGPNAARTWALY